MNREARIETVALSRCPTNLCHYFFFFFYLSSSTIIIRQTRP